MQKFGIRVPKSVQEAFWIDRDTVTKFWTDAILKNTKKVIVDFEIIDGFTPEEIHDGNVTFLKDSGRFGCHMIFNMKMTLTHKARLVVGGNTTSVVSRDSVRIAFIIAGINELKISAYDIGNEYLNEKCRERIWLKAGPEFPPEWQVKPVNILRALYGLKRSGASCRANFSKTLVNELHFQKSQDRPEISESAY